jgi:hypothetical protein
LITLGSPSKKGGQKKKKTLVLTLGSPPEKGGKKKKKNPGINLGQPVGEGRKKKKKKKKVPILPRNVIERTDQFCRGTSRRTHARTDYVPFFFSFTPNPSPLVGR